MSIRILICDDHTLMQRGIRTLIESEPGMEIVGAASDSETALRLAQTAAPDVMLMDISMPGIGGIEATRQIVQRHPTVRVLVLTVHEDEKILQEALRAGASGYIIKRAAEAELLDAIRIVSRGDVYVHPAMTRVLLLTLKARPQPEAALVEPLTARELEVLRLLARGFTNRQISEKLHLSVRTVESHRANITGKLGIRSRVELVNYVQTHHLLDAPGAND